MKLITLNIWRGIVFEPLIKFVTEHAKDVDIFCFQEVFNNPSGMLKRKYTHKPNLTIYSELKKVLPKFASYIHPVEDYDESQAMFVKKSIAVETASDVFVYRSKNAMQNGDPSTSGVNVEYVTFRNNGKTYTVANLHGHWTNGFSGDNPARLLQSHNIKKFLQSVAGSKILCGDFNMAIDTKSMHMLEGDMRNLAREYGVVTTRSSLYTKKTNTLSDYILVSPSTVVKDFRVLQDEVSDHLPLYLEFE